MIKKIFLAALIVLLFNLTYCDPPTIAKYSDPVGTAQMEGKNPLNRVEKKAVVTYAYTLNKNGHWTQFPDLALTFYLPFSQFVTVKYNIQYLTSGLDWFVTRLIVDKKENILFRIHTGYHNHHAHTNYDEIWLEKGMHTIVL